MQCYLKNSKFPMSAHRARSALILQLCPLQTVTAEMSASLPLQHVIKVSTDFVLHYVINKCLYASLYNMSSTEVFAASLYTTSLTKLSVCLPLKYVNHHYNMP